MKIESILKSKTRGDLRVVYEDADDVPAGKDVAVVHAYCFCGGKLVIAYHATNGYWTLPGGSVEAGEPWCDATIREVKEETNMKVLDLQLIGYQEIELPDGTTQIQTRAMCIVEPYGDFTGDPDDDISEIKLIEPSALKEYLDWGEIGERIIQRGLELLESKKNPPK